MRDKRQASDKIQQNDSLQVLACDVAIIGAGACGLSLAFYLSEIAPQLKVAIFECELEAGKKLARTGNGRCNIANTCWQPDFYHSLSWQNEQAYVDFWQAFLKETDVKLPLATKDFWQKVGVFLYEQDGWLYPHHLSAKQLRLQLVERCLQNNVQLYLGQTVSHIEKTTSNFQFVSKSDDFCYHVNARYLVLATGGFSQSNAEALKKITDSLEAWHIPIIKSQPGLVQLQTKPNYLRLTGLRLKVNARLMLSKQAFVLEQGEVLFTKYGISGIVSLILANYYQQLQNKTYIAKSRQVLLTQNEAQKLKKHLRACQFIWPKQKSQDSDETTYLLLDLLPELKDEEVLRFCEVNNLQITEFRNKEQEAFLLSALLPSKLQAIIMEQLELYYCQMATFTLDNLLYFLRNWPLVIQSTLGFQEAQVSLGGVCLSAINPSDCSLKKLARCFVGGEMLDLVGDCGGYNLMLAVWTALKIAKAIKRDNGEVKN